MQRHPHGYWGGPGMRRPGPPFRVHHRSGLLGTLLIGGVGYMLGHQQAQYHQHSPQQPAQPSASTQNDQLAQLKLLGQLRESGVLTEEEFQEQKQKILQNS